MSPLRRLAVLLGRRHFEHSALVDERAARDHCRPYGQGVQAAQVNVPLNQPHRPASEAQAVRREPTFDDAKHID